MQDLVDMFSKTGEGVVDLFSVTFVTVNVSLELERHLRFVDCKVSAEWVCSKYAVTDREICEIGLNKKWDISGCDEEVGSCRILFRALDGLKTRHWLRK